LDNSGELALNDRGKPAGVIEVVRAGFFAALIGIAPAAAFAQWTTTPYAAESIEHDSNIFDLTTPGPAPQGKSGPTFADTFLESRAGIDGTYLLNQEKFFGTAEFRRFGYENFTVLDHNELLLDGGLTWKLAHTFDGMLEYRHEERMVQFYVLQASSTQLVLETENLVTGSVNVNLTPEWRLESLGKDLTLDSPRTDIPGLSLHQESLHEGVRYLGVSHLSAGVDAEYLQGTYSHDSTALIPDFHQITLAAAATYIVSGLTNFSGNIGYTRRTDSANAPVSFLTGKVNYQHSITGKTSINVELNRAVNTYLTTAGTEIDTSASVSGIWQASYKIAVRAGYSYTTSNYPQEPAPEPGGPPFNRLDHFQVPSAELDYQVLRWLSIRAYGRYLKRNSNEQGFTFDGTIVGIELVAKQPARNQCLMRDLC
jgi:hypothetical protein